jgi:DNA helicase HerA-like ATPase
MTSYEVGRVVAVHGFRVKVELHPENKSPSRAGLEGVHLAIAINSFLSFEIGAGEIVIGNITDLDARESFDSSSSGDLTLELVKPRRIASVQLLGTLQPRPSSAPRRLKFIPSITVLPTLDTPVHVAVRSELNAVFADAPKRNRPEAAGDQDTYDAELDLGVPTGTPENRLFGSFNDLFSRPLAIVGNTGSGKSYTLASIVQRAVAKSATDPPIKRPRFFILDINGEYGRAFGVSPGAREPDHVYLNGQDYWLPIWLMNAHEVCEWLSATEQTQEPVLKACWASLKSATSLKIEAITGAANFARQIQRLSTGAVETAYVGQNIKAAYGSLVSLLNADQRNTLADELRVLDVVTRALPQYVIGAEAGPVNDAATALLEKIESLEFGEAETITESADKPIAFPASKLRKAPLHTFAETEGNTQLANWLIGLQLRLDNRLSDRRWSAFTRYTKLDFSGWLSKLGIGKEGAQIQVLDLSMLAHEALPYACGLFGRVLLELRERIPAADRFKEPWVIVLEEAHNYIRPHRQEEDRGVAISRGAFERIAKEGRKFGLSLIVASQRPSEISQTILSQCANLFMHRLQNPQDIEHFKAIIPEQARRLLDQIMVLAQGEAIIFGSAFQIPTRVQIHCPTEQPHSQTSAPYWEWHSIKAKGVDMGVVLTNWGLTKSK